MKNACPSTAGPELELHPREAGVDGTLDLSHQHVQRVLDPEVGADRHPVGGSAQGTVQGQAAPLGVRHPPGDVQSGPRELVALDEGETGQEIVGGLDVLPDDPGHHVLAQGVEGGEGVLGGVGG